ncbi:MAG TPA: saccharopine dehydrogenase C-terminal domain-containing protein [Gemmatimonadota bacterium]|nr:saccharopine dehydrogenase C-terminal domain-containing protein [Gemmatimonadota bacterium]
MKRVVVLGAGRVGGLIARELAREPEIEVQAADTRAEAADQLKEAGVETVTADLADPRALRAVVEGADVAVVAVPGALGPGVLETLVDAGVPAVDISFSPEDPGAFDAGARAAGIPVVVDFGVAPGLSNLMVARSAADMDPVESVRILVGGLPLERDGVWDYRAVFSPADVIQEYVRPCRMRVDGADVTVPALTDVEEVEFEGVGTLEAFNTDGLRTLLETIPARTMVEKTMRWPGHAAKARALREAGFFDFEPVATTGGPVVPMVLAVRLLSHAWRLEEGEEEFTALRVEVAGTRGGRRARDVWELLDRTDAETGATSMARTTGFPAVEAAKLLLAGAVPPGVWPPERLPLEVVDRVLEAVRSRGVEIRRRMESPAG